MVYILKKPSVYVNYHATMESEYIYQGYTKWQARQWAAIDVLVAAGYVCVESLDDFQVWKK